MTEEDFNRLEQKVDTLIDRKAVNFLWTGSCTAIIVSHTSTPGSLLSIVSGMLTALLSAYIIYKIWRSNRKRHNHKPTVDSEWQQQITPMDDQPYETPAELNRRRAIDMSNVKLPKFADRRRHLKNCQEIVNPNPGNPDIPEDWARVIYLPEEWPPTDSNN